LWRIPSGSERWVIWIKAIFAIQSINKMKAIAASSLNRRTFSLPVLRMIHPENKEGLETRIMKTDGVFRNWPEFSVTLLIQSLSVISVFSVVPRNLPG